MTRFLTLLALVLLLPACDAFGGDDGPESVGGYPVLFEGQWGFIDAEGRLVGSPTFDFADEVVGGLSAVRRGALWGYAAPDGRVVVEPQYAAAGRFEGRLAPVRSETDGYFYIDATGATVGEAGFDSAEALSDGRGAVRRGFLWGYVGEDGGLAIDLQYAAVGPFAEGLAPVRTAEGWRYIDRSGAFAFTTAFEEAGPFSETGLAPVRELGSEVWKYVDRQGGIAINSTFEEAEPFSEDVAAVQVDGQTGFIDPNGDWVVEPTLASAGVFSEGRAAVRFSNRWTYVRRDDGLIITSPAFSTAKPFRGGLAQVTLGSGNNLRVGYIDPEGTVVWEPTR